jgi:hypothetical protein
LHDNPSFWVIQNFPDYARFAEQHQPPRQPANKFVDQTYFTGGTIQIDEVAQIKP